MIAKEIGVKGIFTDSIGTNELGLGVAVVGVVDQFLGRGLIRLYRWY
jgi:hypothetical protein